MDLNPLLLLVDVNHSTTGVRSIGPAAESVAHPRECCVLLFLSHGLLMNCSVLCRDLSFAACVPNEAEGEVASVNTCLKLGYRPCLFN